MQSKCSYIIIAALEYECKLSVRGRNLTKSASYEPLLTMPSKVFSFLEIMVKQVKSSSQKQVDISESAIINQSISMNQFYPIEALIFIRELSVFP